MRLWLDFWRNIGSGLRVALGLPISLLAFRISVRQLLLVFVFNVAIGAAIDYARAGPDPVLATYAVVYEGFMGAVLLLMAALLSAAYRQPHLKLALPVIVLASEPVLSLLSLILTLPGAQGGLFGYSIQVAGFWVFIIWLALVYWRAMATALMPARPRYWLRSVGGAMLLLLGVPIAIWAHQPWWREAARTPVEDARYVSPASEAAITAQQTMLGDALDELEDERPQMTDLYFVGFAPYAREDVFRKDMEVARDLFDDRFDTDGRSLLLINNPRTVMEEPLATVSNLRTALKEIGSAIDTDDDVVMVYLESHGSRDYRLAVDFWPLQLDPLTPQLLRSMLDESGIKWRIIVVSACYSGGYIEPLKDEHTLIMTASAFDRTSFGCGNESDATYFGDALFQHALRFDDSFVSAFGKARERIAERERAQGVSPPSNPQIYVGDAMAAKLPQLEAALRARRTGNTI
jgi:Peptidase C13 family